MPLALGFAISGMIASASPPLGTTGARADIVAELRQSFQMLIDQHQLPNAQVVIEQDGRTLAAFRLGFADVEARRPLPENAIFRLYSMSKPITSVAIMMLADQGKLSLDDPVGRFLPELDKARVYARGDMDDMVTVPAARPITIRDLLTHSSGFTYQFMGNTPVHQFYRRYGVMRETAVGKMPGDAASARTLDELVTRLGPAPLLHQPGERFSYGYSTTVLGAVVERASGMPIDRFFRRRIFDPLEMRDTGFGVEDAQLPRFVVNYVATAEGIAPIETALASEYRDNSRLRDGGGALVGTAQDYLHFAEMIANRGTWRGHRLLKAETADAMLMPRLRTGGTGLEDTAFSYGFAIGDAASEAMGGLPAGAVGWAGSGNTYFFADPAHRAVALFMTNALTPSGFTKRTEIVRMMLNRAAMRLMQR